MGAQYLFYGISDAGRSVGQGIERQKAAADAYRGLHKYATASGLLTKDEADVMSAGQLKGAVAAREFKNAQVELARRNQLDQEKSALYKEQIAAMLAHRTQADQTRAALLKKEEAQRRMALELAAGGGSARPEWAGELPGSEVAGAPSSGPVGVRELAGAAARAGAELDPGVLSAAIREQSAEKEPFRPTVGEVGGVRYLMTSPNSAQVLAAGGQPAAYRVGQVVTGDEGYKQIWNGKGFVQVSQKDTRTDEERSEQADVNRDGTVSFPEALQFKAGKQGGVIVNRPYRAGSTNAPSADPLGLFTK